MYIPQLFLVFFTKQFFSASIIKIKNLIVKWTNCVTLEREEPRNREIFPDCQQSKQNNYNTLVRRV